MYALLTMFTLGPGTREMAEKMGEQFSSALKAMPGFKSLIMFGDEDIGEYGGISVWESKEAAEAVQAATRPRLEEALKDIVKGEPKRGLYEVTTMI